MGERWAPPANELVWGGLTRGETMLGCDSICGLNCPGKCCVILIPAELGWNCFWYIILFILLDWLLGEVELAL